MPGTIPGSGTPIRLGVSTCLLGKRVRDHDGHPLDHCPVHTLGQHVEWVLVYPKTKAVVSAARESMRLAGDLAHPRLVTVKTGIDHTKRMLRNHV
jgi:uncharacterized protein YbbK (DUF523 family)